MAKQSPGLVAKQFFKDVDKAAPGWAPLFVAVFILVEYLDFPESVFAFGTSYEVSTELIALMLAFLLYQLGDALDDLIFKEDAGNNKRRTRQRFLDGYLCQQGRVQERLGFSDGTYDASMKLMAAAEKQRPLWFLNFFNELAKFLRSLGPAFFIAGVALALRSHLLVAGACVFLGTMCLATYPQLKVVHIRRLYRGVDLLCAQDEGKNFEVVPSESMRLVFWQKELVYGAAV